MASIEIRKDRQGKFRFSIKANNGEVIAVSESYRDKAKAKATIRSLQTSAAKAKVVDLTMPAPTPAKATKKSAKKAAKKSAAKSAKKTAKTSAKTSARNAAPTTAKKSAKKAVAAKPVTRGSAKKSTPKPASPSNGTGTGTAADRAPRSFTPIGPRTPLTRSPSPRSPSFVSTADDQVRTPATDVETDDLDTVEVTEGADVVTPDQLGDGDQASSDIDFADDDDDMDNTSDAAD